MADPGADAPDVAAALDGRIAALLSGEAGGHARLLISGELPASVRAALPAGCEVLANDPEAPDAPSTGQGDTVERVPVAVLVLEDARPGDGTEARLGSACRRFPGRVVVWQRDGDAHPPLPATRFFAHGFRRLLCDEHQGVRHAVYEYRLADYKRAPDWLNARFWANPERFTRVD